MEKMSAVRRPAVTDPARRAQLIPQMPAHRPRDHLSAGPRDHLSAGPRRVAPWNALLRGRADRDVPRVPARCEAAERCA